MPQPTTILLPTEIWAKLTEAEQEWLLNLQMIIAKHNAVIATESAIGRWDNHLRPWEGYRLVLVYGEERISITPPPRWHWREWFNTQDWEWNVARSSSSGESFAPLSPPAEAPESLIFLLLLAHRDLCQQQRTTTPYSITKALLGGLFTKEPRRLSDVLRTWLHNNLCKSDWLIPKGGTKGKDHVLRTENFSELIVQRCPVAGSWPEELPHPKTIQFTRPGLDQEGLPMVYIPGGTFWMGKDGDEGRADERPPHRVRLSPFFIGVEPVTQKQYQTFCKHLLANLKTEEGWAAMLKRLHEADDLVQRYSPLNMVDIDKLDYPDAGWLPVLDPKNREKYQLDLINWLRNESTQSTVPTNASYARYRTMVDWRHMHAFLGWYGLDLPTEAWYEYVCRGPTGQDEQYGNWCGVKAKIDELWQWCQDWYAPYWTHTAWDPRGPDAPTQERFISQRPTEGPYKVLRRSGTSQSSSATLRGGNFLRWRAGHDGFRPAIALDWSFLSRHFNLAADLPGSAHEQLQDGQRRIDELREELFTFGPAYSKKITKEGTPQNEGKKDPPPRVVLRSPLDLTDRLEQFRRQAYEALHRAQPTDTAQQWTVIDDFGCIRLHRVRAYEGRPTSDGTFRAGLDLYAATLVSLQNGRVGELRWLDDISAEGGYLPADTVRVNIAAVTRVPDLGWYLVAERHETLQSPPADLIWWFARAGWVISPSLRERTVAGGIFRTNR